MTPTETTAILRQFNEWRRSEDETVEQPDPREIGEAIDAAIAMIERLEAAEKSDAESIAMYRKARDERDALPGAKAQNATSVPSEEDESVRKAWARFSNELHRSPDAPYPGMSEAFEKHFSQSFTDREWRAESGVWAAAWKAAKNHGAQPAPSVPTGFVWPECPKRRQSHVLFDDGYEEGWAVCVATIKAVLAVAPEAKP